MKIKHSNSPNPTKTGLVLGFARNAAERDFLLAAGIERVWTQGHNGESMLGPLRAFRGRAAVLGIASDLRALIVSAEPVKRHAVVAAMAYLERNSIDVCDMRNPDLTQTELLDLAFKSVANSRFHNDKRKARRIGSTGGTAKGVAAAAKRKAADPHGLLEKILRHPELSWRVKRDLINDVCSISTARRLIAAGFA